MVKVRKGSRKGQTKWTKSAKKSARKAGIIRKSLVPKGPLREAWDMKLSGTENMKRVGLASTINTLEKRRRLPTDSATEVQPATASESTEKPDVLRQLELEAARPEAKPRLHVRPGEERALQDMIRAHGQDYEAMARDIKRNYLQWTANQLRRKCERRARAIASV